MAGVDSVAPGGGVKRSDPTAPTVLAPRPGGGQTIVLVPPDAPTSGAAEGARSNIGSGTTLGGTSVTPEQEEFLLEGGPPREED